MARKPKHGRNRNIRIKPVLAAHNVSLAKASAEEIAQIETLPELTNSNLAQSEPELAYPLESYDENSLSQAKAYWFFGEWQKLMAITDEKILTHEDRDRLAILIASAHQQLGYHEEARNYTRKALEWGCPPRVAAQVLIAGVHNTLGKIAALREDEQRMAQHFGAAVDVSNGKDKDLLAHARAVREMSRLGLLPQAVNLIGKEITEQATKRVNQIAMGQILKTELELLHHELSLAQQRQQLYRAPMESGEETKNGRPGVPGRLVTH
jgi:tetratricopeptide (TPR) repeat protein